MADYGTGNRVMAELWQAYFFSPVERRQQCLEVQPSQNSGMKPNREDTQNDLSDATGPLAQTLHYVLWEFMTSGPVKDCHFSQALHRLGKQARNRSDGLSCESATPNCHKPLSLFIVVTLPLQQTADREHGCALLPSKSFHSVLSVVIDTHHQLVWIWNQHGDKCLHVLMRGLLGGETATLNIGSTNQWFVLDWIKGESPLQSNRLFSPCLLTVADTLWAAHIPAPMPSPPQWTAPFNGDQNKPSHLSCWCEGFCHTSNKSLSDFLYGLENPWVRC